MAVPFEPCDRLTQRRKSRGIDIFAMTFADRLDGGVRDGRRHAEVRFADTEIDDSNALGFEGVRLAAHRNDGGTAYRSGKCRNCGRHAGRSLLIIEAGLYRSTERRRIRPFLRCAILGIGPQYSHNRARIMCREIEKGTGMKTIGLAAAMAIVFTAATSALALDINPLSLLKGAVEAVVEDRSAADIGKDAEIKTKITANVIDKMASDVISINADVYEQDVMLTGSVETIKQRIQAGELARSVEDVKRVYNDILVQRDIDKQKGAVENFVDDTVIEGKANALLLDANGVNVTNFRWRSVGGHVFLFGRALSPAELNKAVKVVRGIKGVSRITNRVKIRPKS